MGQRIIGLDVGTWSIKVAVLESSLRQAVLSDFREHHLPRDPQGQLVEGELVPAISASLSGLEPDAISTAVPGSRVMMRELSLPFADEKRIASVLGFQLESELPIDLDDAVYDFYITGKDDDGATLLCPAVERVWLDGYLADLKEAGADPRYLSLTTLTNAALAEHLEVDASERSVALIDIGHRTTSVTVVRDGQVQAARTASRGGHQLTLALMRGLQLDYGQAESLKHTGVRFDGRLPEGVDQGTHAHRARIVARALEPLLREIRMTIHAHEERIGHRIDEVVVMGGTSRLPGVVDLVGRTLDRNARTPQLAGPLWAGAAGVGDISTSGLTSVGLALRHLSDSSRHQVNFRQGTLAYESDFKALRDRATWLAVFALVLLALFFGRKYVQMKTLEGQQVALTAQLDAHAERVFGEDMKIPAADEPLERFITVQQLMASPPEAEARAVYPAMTAFKVFYDVTDAQAAVNAAAKTVEEPAEGEETEPKQVKAEVELINVGTELKSASINGVAYNIEAIEAFATKLREHPCFKKVDRQETKRNQYGDRKGWMTFTIKVDVTCPLPEDEIDKEKAAEDDKAKAKSPTSKGEEE